MEMRSLRLPIISLISILVIGSIGFHYIEDINIYRSIYWTVVTITTVGYGDITPHTELGMAFSMILMTIGVGTILYTLTIIGRNIIEGKVWEMFTMSEKEEEVKKLSNHLIVCGYGDLGRTIAQELQLGNEEIAIIDISEEVVREDASELPYIIGDATKEETLENAGIHRARGLFAALPGDSENILLALSAKDLKSDIRIVTKAETNEGAKHLHRAGAEAVVLPDKEGGIRMARSFLHPEITSLYDHLLMGNVGRAGTVRVPKGGKLDGVTIKNSHIREEIGTSIIAIKRGEELITNPKLDQEIMGDDTLIVMGTLSQIEKLKEKLLEK